MERGKTCNPGDKVRFLNEKGEGIVKRNTKEFIYVENEDGFEIPMLHQDVILIEKAQQTQLDSDEAIKKNIQMGNTSIVEAKSIQKKDLRLAQGIYLAYAPVNQEVLISGELRIYIINYTKQKISYSLNFICGTRWQQPYSGVIEPTSAILLDSLDRKDVENHIRGIFQCLILEPSTKGIANPISVGIDLKQNRFLKEDMYLENALLSLKSVNVLLSRYDELTWVQKIDNSQFKKTEFTGIQAQIIEDKSYISKYAISDYEAEVDLHIENLIEDSQKIEDWKKINIQIDAFTKCLESALKHSYKRVVFIHGVGVGVLKMKIHKLLDSYENIEYRDAPIAKYGIGATEVLIHKRK
jgi:hypothetical protein